MAGSGSGAGSGPRWLVLGLAALAVTLALVATTNGPGLTDDSVNYLSTGANVADGRGWVMLADQPLTIFPPGVPALVAIGELAGVTGQTTLRLLSALSFGGIVLLGSALVRRATSRAGVVAGAAGILAVSPALLGITTMAWSEPPFIVLVLLFLLRLDDVVDRRSFTRADVLALSALSSLAFLARYIGVALVVLAGATLLRSIRPLDRRLVARVTAFGALSSLVPIAVMLRNHAADGTYLGKRIPSSDSVADSAHRLLVTLGEWANPLANPNSPTLAWLGVATVALLTGAVALGWRRATTGHARLSMLLGYVTIYTAYLVVASLGTAFEPINSRYLSPVFVPLVVVGAIGASAILERWPSPTTRRGVLSASVALMLLFGAGTVEDVRRGARDGIGYNVNGIVGSDLAARALHLAETDRETVLYSNLPFGLWAATRLQPVQWSPLSEGFRGAPIQGELESLVARVACAPDRSYLVRYRYGHRRAMNTEGIREALNVKRVIVADDGAIFQLTNRGEVPCEISPPAPSRRR